MTTKHTDMMEIVGARQNNLKNISLSIPKNAITVFVGISGSGKSSLVFGTIAAESQRQLNDTFPAFIRHRLPHYGQPDVDEIYNLSPAIIINQKPIGGNARSTVGTASDIYTLLRLLFSRAGKPFVGYSTIFSFNHPSGMCPRCEGLGLANHIAIDKLIDETRSLNEGAIRYSTFMPGTWRWKRYVCSGLFDNDKKIADFSTEEKALLLHGENITPENPLPGWPKTAKFEGVIPRFTRSYLNKERDGERDDELKGIVTLQQCPVCQGMRLNQTVLSCKIAHNSLGDCVSMPISDLNVFIGQLTIPAVAPVLEKIKERLAAMCSIGLGYLDLNRTTTTLSGGESQRLKMVRHLGSSLNGMTYIIDEPSTGLHPADVSRLNTLIIQLCNKGNTILLVEHDSDMIEIADHIVELGPAAGEQGGQIVYQGDLHGLHLSATPTGKYLGQKQPLKNNPRRPCDYIHLHDASLHNLQHVSVAIPLGVMAVVTGVAGSGKSSLIMGVMAQHCPNAAIIDQKPIHTSSRSHIASWSGAFDIIRERFAKKNGVSASWFSANSKGACPECKGLGEIQTDLAFMDTLSLPCEACQGLRYNSRALHYLLHGKNIAEILAMSVDEAWHSFHHDTQLAPIFKRLHDVGLGYLRLGESLNHLSGGEQQRLKLATHLGQKGDIYIFDEPTTGLHPSDVIVLTAFFDRLVDEGNSVIIIEHNIALISQADWVIDIGPGAGKEGGRVLFSGPLPALLSSRDSLTAACLRDYVGKSDGRSSQ
ncbi:excinuclease ABC subunit UvrA [Dickeya dadantii]|uniref:ATP-binding cassette domain-containing protein n=1 Tax=Dickeya dadantii TaxID=204038 RepID=UPI001CF5AA80|nr:excinuclease ABC subunit UvrA [Dickeya dadantii]MCA7014969.1 excinuclease ABC subunit UvrA [Dickeya dadantii]